jgi:hypothetical protein
MRNFLRIVTACLTMLWGHLSPVYSQQPNCINFDSLIVDTNYVTSGHSISNFYIENGIRFLTSNAIGKNDSIYGTFNTGCAQPNVTMGKYLFLKGAVKVDFSHLPTLPNLIVFSVNAQCNQTYFYATNNGEVYSVRATQNSHTKSSTGVTTSYSEGTFIIEGPISSFTFGGSGVGIDLICYEITPENCLFEDLTIEKGTCINDSFVLELNFRKSSPNDSGYAVLVNDSLHGVYTYDSLPISLGPMPANCDTTYNILLIDQQDTLCKALYIFENTCCQECTLSNLEVNIENCLPDSFYSVEISLDHSGSISDRFNIYTKNNQPIGTFSYTSLPLLFAKFPISGDTIEYIRLCDSKIESCCIELEFAPFKCPPKCDITNMSATFINCDSDSSYSVEIDFIDLGEAGSGYDVYSQNEFIETKFVNPPFTIMNFPVRDTIHDQIKVCVTDHPDCCALIDIASPSCAPSAVDQQINPDNYNLIVDHSTISLREKTPSSHSILSYQLFDLSGRRVLANTTLNLPVRDLRIPCPNLIPGLYFLVLQQDNGHALQFKFFKF